MNKILVFIDWFTPAYKAGGPIVSVSKIIENLSFKFKFFVVTSNQDIDKAEVISKEKVNIWLLKEKYSIIYLSKSHQKTSFYKNILNKINPDVIYINSLFSSRFSIIPILNLKIKKKIILAPRGMLGKGALNIKSFKKNIFLKIITQIKAYNKIIWHASTQNEKLEIESIFGESAKVVIAQNFSSNNINIVYRTKKNIKNKLTILFISRISKKKNLSFLVDEINQCNYKHNIHLKIIGFQEDIDYCKICINKLKKYNISYEILGSIPHSNLSYHYKKSDIFCLPTHHENFGHVILEALSYGLPIIISNKTPWRNLELKKIGFDLEIISNNFAKKIDYFFEMKNIEYAVYSRNAIRYYNNINSIDSLIDDHINLFS